MPLGQQRQTDDVIVMDVSDHGNGGRAGGRIDHHPRQKLFSLLAKQRLFPL